MQASKNHDDQAQGLSAMWRALAHRNFRLFFVGQGISLIGTWMTRVATYWLIFRLAGEDQKTQAVMLGMVGFTGQIPSLLLGPVAGALVDRWNRHRLLTITQVLSMLQSAGLAAVAFGGGTDMTTIVCVFVLAAFQGAINAFDMPTRQSFMVEMIDRREDLANAIALNSSLVNGSRLVGPALAGLIIAAAGTAWCFTLDAISYLAVIASLLLMVIAPVQRPQMPPPVLSGMREGIRYAFCFSPIRAILLLVGLIGFMAIPYTALLPIFADNILGGGSPEFGFLQAAAGLGALIGVLYLASRRTVVGLGRVIAISAALFGASLIGFALSQHLWLSMALLAFTGMGMMMQMASSNTILQTIVDEDKRGRVMSLYTMAFLGTAPFGSLFASTLAPLIGAQGTVIVCGVSALIGAGLFAWNLPKLRTVVRPLYVRMGILPELAVGIQTATELRRPPEQ
jgi:MFS family permease